MWLPVGMDGGKRVLSSLVCMHAPLFSPVCNGSRLNKLTPHRTNGNANAERRGNENDNAERPDANAGFCLAADPLTPCETSKTRGWSRWSWSLTTTC